jgi:hypothetical protein
MTNTFALPKLEAFNGKQRCVVKVKKRFSKEFEQCQTGILEVNQPAGMNLASMNLASR